MLRRVSHQLVEFRDELQDCAPVVNELCMFFALFETAEDEAVVFECVLAGFDFV
jgi:hypothetical protein